MSEDFQHLVHRCQSGDELAWEMLVRRFQNRVVAVAYHYVRSREEARDVAQEVFVRIYRSMPSFRQTDRFVPWMLQVARSCSIDHLRRRTGGITLIVVGSLLLMVTVFDFSLRWLEGWWPAGLIVLGAYIVSQSRQPSGG